ncbi:hypothetical protein HU200_062339 [Digitaria exilis]|uniref:F-box domain-containing protein n=1 Tax=Digitaria exilis TaxID=1010633 RepID=A0A835ACI8_9POAL|nr:hypothetical protein HU200_062339 [Digitaria exilis]
MDPAAAVAGMDDLVEEVLLRSPPDEPAHLSRAALVCRRWCRIVTGPGFRRRFRERHRAPPMLGFLHRPLPNVPHSGAPCGFAPTASFRPRNADLGGGRYALDSRHGRVLVGVLPSVGATSETRLAVWDPVTGERMELPEPPLARERHLFSWNSVVLCASSRDGACDHLDCSRGQFLVVVCGHNHSVAVCLRLLFRGWGMDNPTMITYLRQSDKRAVLTGDVIRSWLQ